ncbi:MAG: hypothetical protein AB7D06_07950 [Pedobacter sp.]
MLELTIPLKESFNKSALDDLTLWFKEHPSNASWYVISDYCFGDETKKNDAVCFSILLNHDKIANIKEYINHFAPKDIKSTRSVSPEFLRYINSPVIFNVTFLFERDSKLLKEYSTKKNMENFLPAFKSFVQQIDKNSSFEEGYVDSVLKRVNTFENDFKKNNFNKKLSRHIYYVATFASLIFHYLTIVKSPTHIQWVSDRDALSWRYDGFVYDLAYFMFLSEYSSELLKNDSTEKTILNKPKFIFPIPEKSGDNFYDELVRLPDYLVGTLADLNIENNEFSKDKYYTILYYSLLNSKNHAVFQLYGNGEKLSTRRLAFKA